MGCSRHHNLKILLEMIEKHGKGVERGMGHMVMSVI